MKQLLRAKEAAKLLHISPSFLYQLADQRRISCYRIGNRILFSEEQIEECLKRHEIKEEGE